MIIIDYSGIAIAAMFSNKGGMIDSDENLIRHLILNSIRSHNVKYRDEYGQLYIACDNNSWRKKYFKEYKANRKKNRESDSTDWEKVFDIMNKVKEELHLYSPYHVIDIPECEADDIIGVLTQLTQEFGCSEKVMIISNDKDFIQLQRYGNVKQFSPNQNKMFKHPKPLDYLMEHILRGDGGDGVPNVLSVDDTFVDVEKKQKQLRQTKIDEWKKEWNNLPNIMSIDEYRNFQRNQRVIDLEYIPDDVKNLIINHVAGLKKKTNLKMLNYLVKNRCRQLIECINDFFVK